jgi:hypothetical protein
MLAPDCHHLYGILTPAYLWFNKNETKYEKPAKA